MFCSINSIEELLANDNHLNVAVVKESTTLPLSLTMSVVIIAFNRNRINVYATV